MTFRLRVAVALTAVLFGAAPLAWGGDWLGGQYFGQTSGCGACGGSLYGLGPVGFDSDHLGPLAPAEPIIIGEPLEAAPEDDGAPIELIHPAAYAPSARRSARTAPQVQTILQAPATGGAVRVMTHRSLPERLLPPAERIVAPSAWSGRLWR